MERLAVLAVAMRSVGQHRIQCISSPLPIILNAFVLEFIIGISAAEV